MIHGFLLGVIVTGSVLAALYFFKFWRRTRDFLFLAFAIFFVIEGLARLAVLVMATPNEGAPWLYLVRLFAALLILAAILKKNYGPAKLKTNRTL